MPNLELVKPRPIVWTDEKVARLWDYYTRTGAPYFSQMHGREILQATRLPLNKSLRLLDFGCGPGFIWDHLKRIGSGWHYTGLDFTAESIETLQRKAGSDPLFDGAFHITSLPAPLETAAFDVLTLIEVVEHLNDTYLAGTIAEVARLLKPGGHLVISTPNEEQLELSHKFCPDCGAVFHEWQHLRNWGSATLAGYVSAYGFKPIRTVTTDFGATGIRWPLYLVKRLAGRKSPHLLMVFRRIFPAPLSGHGWITRQR